MEDRAAPTERISLEEVRHVARLARLALDEAELEKLKGELSDLLEHVDAVRALDTSGVPPTAHPFPLSNVLRDDVVQPCLERSVVLACAPAVADDRFEVPRILGGEAEG